MGKSTYFSLILGAAYLVCAVWLFIFRVYLGHFSYAMVLFDSFLPFLKQFQLALSLFFAFLGVQYLFIGTWVGGRKQVYLSWNFYLIVLAVPLVALIFLFGMKLAQLFTAFIVATFFPPEVEYFELLKYSIFLSSLFCFGLVPALIAFVPQIFLRRFLRS